MSISVRLIFRSIKARLTFKNWFQHVYTAMWAWKCRSCLKRQRSSIMQWTFLQHDLRDLSVCAYMIALRAYEDNRNEMDNREKFLQGEALSLLTRVQQTMPLTALLFCTSVFVAFRLFSSIRLYNLHLRRELVNSPSAEFVSTELDFTPLEAPSLAWRLFSWFRYHFSVSWRFLLNFKPPARHSSPGTRVERVQQLRVWSPGELELHLCAVYSPAHALLWTVTNGANWIVMFAIMAAVGLQVWVQISFRIHALLISYRQIFSRTSMNVLSRIRQ